MAIVLPHGVLFRGGEEGTIRKELIENDHIDTIIGLPSNIFFGTGIPTVIIVLKQKRKNSDILIVDASKGFLKEGKNNKLQASNLKKIADTVIGRYSVSRYSEVVSKSQIRENDYNLNIPRYVDSSPPAESWDLYASMFGGIPESELDNLKDFWTALPDLRSSLFDDNGTPYVELKVDDLGSAIREHANVLKFTKRFSKAFADFGPWLRGELIDKMANVSIPQMEPKIGEVIFKRLASIPLIDKYHAYQLLDNQWQQIAIDLEILQTEGFTASRAVDPNMVMKKKKGKEVEEQEGWIGRVMPFDLVQRMHHKDELNELQVKETRLSEIDASFEAALESLSEEENEADTVHESGDKWVNAVVIKEAKQWQAEAKKSGKFDEDSYEAKVIQVADWIVEERALKAAIKKDDAALHLKTKDTIESLSEKQAKELLNAKWILPLNESLAQLPVQRIEMLTGRLQALVEKYETTYADNAREIRETEAELAGMIDELVGDEFDMKGLFELKKLLGRRN